MSRRSNKPDTDADISLRDCLDTNTSFVVVSGAGSGKTTSLIKALKYIDDRNGQHLRQQGKRIACITYTTTAEKEILDDVGHDKFYHVSTIHSFLWELIRPFQSNIKQWVTNKIQLKIDDLVQKKEAFSSRVQQRTRDKNEADTIRYREIAEVISNVSIFNYETGSRYEEGILGHNDIVTMVPEMIISNPLLQSILAKKYPYFFIDESQDTIPAFIDAMKEVDKNQSTFCLGFFGDPMQKIYMTGTGAITLEDSWKQINKPENFRCSTQVLNLVNKIRFGGDDLQQTGGRKEKIGDTWEPVNGSAKLFILTADENREDRILEVREFLSKTLQDPLWISDSKESDLKILVIEHRMAAKRLEFGDLFAAFNDESTESIKSGFKEGTLWAVQPFVKFLIPLIEANTVKNNFEVIKLLREFCPKLDKSYLKSIEEPRQILSSLKDTVHELTQLINSPTTTVRDILTYVQDNEIANLDDRISKRLIGETAIELDEDEETLGRTDSVIQKYFAVPVQQLIGYQIYVNDESVYSTQHSVKGAEFERVVVILDDNEGNTNSYSYEKLLGITELSSRDQENIAAGNDNTLDRTRRLLYVCCSRSLLDLAVILFVSDVDEAKNKIIASDIFKEDDIKTIADLNLIST